MTGVEQLTVWLFGIFCTSVSVCSVARSWAVPRSAAVAAQVGIAEHHARAHVEAHRVVAEAQFGRLTVPAEWSEEEL